MFESASEASDIGSEGGRPAAMAKREKIAPPEGVRILTTPKALVFYHMAGEYSCWAPGLGWFELHQYPKEAGKKPEPPVLKFFHFLQSDILCGAAHHRFPGTEKRFVQPVPRTVHTTTEQYEEYLRRKVWATKTATAQVFHLLGMKKPAQAPAQATAEVNDSLNELYSRVAKIMDMDEADVRKKYSHLNPGLQAMNLRNRLRTRGAAV